MKKTTKISPKNRSQYEEINKTIENLKKNNLLNSYLGNKGYTIYKVSLDEKIIEATGFFLAIGHQPNTDIFKKYLNLDKTGYIINELGSTKTNIPGVFVSGDASDNVYRQAVTAAGTGCMAALDAEKYLSELEN